MVNDTSKKSDPLYGNEQVCLNYSPETSLLLQTHGGAHHAFEMTNEIATLDRQAENQQNQISTCNSFKNIEEIGSDIPISQNFLFLNQNLNTPSDSYLSLANFFINPQNNMVSGFEFLSNSLDPNQNFGMGENMPQEAGNIFGICSNIPAGCQTLQGVQNETMSLNVLNSLPVLPFVCNMAQQPHGNLVGNLPPQRLTPDLTTSIYVNKSSVKLSEAEDWTPNPSRLLDILGELEKLNDVINKLKDECDLPNAKPNLKREKNRLASKACRLKKKATHETNKIKLEGLEIEFKMLVYTLHFMSWEIISHISLPQNRNEKLSIKLGEIINKYLNGIKVAGDSDNFVKNVLEHTKEHDPLFNANKIIIDNIITAKDYPASSS